ncbi:MAG: prolyl-tRNA synthetase, partial [Candidatus Saccharibacteria bacterium]|nr:prolyl-tRNA synthetase [Candidatus Saccharibacteria bacterium]
FSFGTQKSEQIGLYFSDETGGSKPVVLGSYGIGVTRLMGVIVEHYADDKGIVWPDSVAPYRVYLAGVGENPSVQQAASELYEQLNSAGIDTIWDDRDVRPGEKFADADLMGMPLRLVVSDKSLAAGGAELKSRMKEDTRIIASDSVTQTVVDTLKSLV